MKRTKDLTNEALFKPLTDIEMQENEFIDLHNDFNFTSIIYDYASTQLSIVLNGDTEDKEVLIIFSTVRKFEVSFLYTDSSDDYILLDMFSRGENVNFTSSDDRYFFIDFTNGMHIDCYCKSCLIEYENSG